MATVDPQLLRVAVDAVKALGKSVVNDKGTRIGLGFADSIVASHILGLIVRKLGAPIVTEVPAKEIEAQPDLAEAVSAERIEVKA